MEAAPTNDSLFRLAFSHPEIARQFFMRWIPMPDTSLFDWKSLQPHKLSGFTREFVERREDVVYHLKMQQEGIDSYFLLEHQSKEDRSMALRICEYVLLIWRTHQKKFQKQRLLPFVLPTLLYLGPTPWKQATRLDHLIDVTKDAQFSWLRQWLPQWPFFLVDLTGVPFEKLANGPSARAVLAALQAERTKGLDEICIRRILKELFSEKQEALVKEVGPYLWLYLLHRSNLQLQELENMISDIIPPIERPNYMTTAERLIETGKQQGIEQGIERGLEQGMRRGLQQGQIRSLQTSVIDVLQARFGRIPQGLVDMLSHLSNQKKLRELLRVASNCSDLETFASRL